MRRGCDRDTYDRPVARWDDVCAEAPDLSAAVQASFEAHLHKVLATLRPDGSPRVSGNEAQFAAGDLWLGMMPESVKVRDLQRDPRFALHSAPADPEMTGGDAKLSGLAVEILDDETIAAFVSGFEAERGSEVPEPFHLFRADVLEIVHTRLGSPADHLVVESWHEGRGVHRVERR